jgi:hypothetical protein
MKLLHFDLQQQIFSLIPTSPQYLSHEAPLAEKTRDKQGINKDKQGTLPSFIEEVFKITGAMFD